MRLPVDYKKEVHKSVFDLSTVRRTTMHAGCIYPIYSRKCIAGDKFIIDINALLKSTPLQSPLYGSFKLQTAVFFDSDTNYYGWMDNNTKVATQDLLRKNMHHFNFLPKLESNDGTYMTGSDVVRFFNGQFNNFRSSLLEYMGVPSGTMFHLDSDPTLSPFASIDAGFLLTYLNIFRNYYMNKQSVDVPYVNALDGHSMEDPFAFITAQNLDDLFMYLRGQSDGVDLDDTRDPRLSWLPRYLNSLGRPNGGLLLSTYLPDLYRNLLDDSFNTKVSKVTVDGNSQFTIDSLRFANKLQKLVDRFDISGGRISDWLRTVFGVATRKDLDIPELIGVSQSLIDPSQVTAMAQTGEQGSKDSTDLGQFGGNFDNFSRQRKQVFTASTPGRVMVCVTLVPMVDYSQGVDPELLETKFADRYFPEMENLGYQKVPQWWYSAQPNIKNAHIYPSDLQETMTEFQLSTAKFDYDSVDSVVGKQVAWLPLMTDVNKTYGEFGNGGVYESWILKRRYWSTRYISLPRKDAEHNDREYFVWTADVRISQYINPLEFQYPFMAQTITDPNWFLQMALDIKAIRPKGKRFMPTLE